jgi:hypothetical protein
MEALYFPIGLLIFIVFITILIDEQDELIVATIGSLVLTAIIYYLGGYWSVTSELLNSWKNLFILFDILIAIIIFVWEP